MPPALTRASSAAEHRRKPEDPLNILGLNGRIDRATYAWRGSLLVALKLAIDRWTVLAMTGRRWELTDYWHPFPIPHSLTALSPSEQHLLLLLVALAVPFVWIGIIMTLRRLRDAGLPLTLVALFFFPVLNLFFFAALCLLPSDIRVAGRNEEEIAAIRTANAFVPKGPFASAAIALALTVTCGVALTLFATAFLRRYGWGLFVGLPFCLGALAVLIDSMAEQRPLRRCLLVSGAAVILLGLFLLVLAVEGFICLAMAFPIGLALGLLGGVVGYTIQAARPRHGRPGSVVALAVLFSPLIMAFEAVAPMEPPVVPVTTRLEISGTPEAVWRHVVSFSRLKPPTELLFRSGVAYPVEATIDGHGVGATRHCRFSTGEFVEPITVWDEPRLLAFDVARVPVPMREMTPYRNLNPPHLEGFFASKRGQFRLTPTDRGTTILEGTTWYRNEMWPPVYWTVWSDLIIHQIHSRVLSHIKSETESENRSKA